MRVECKCKRVRYCDEACRQKDEHFHLRNCSAAADNELKQVTIAKRARNTKDGLVGLQNLGNTCYMNSAMQVIANIKFIHEYFIRHKMHEKQMNLRNPLGFQGKLVHAFAMLLERMWSQRGVVVPRNFKQTLGVCCMQFEGFDQ